jgi:flagellar hook-length control protein FliK
MPMAGAVAAGPGLHSGHSEPGQSGSPISTAMPALSAGTPLTAAAALPPAASLWHGDAQAADPDSTPHDRRIAAVEVSTAPEAGTAPERTARNAAAIAASDHSATSQVAIHVARSLGRGHDRLTVALHPAELGIVQVSVELGDPAGARAQITADRPETLEMLRRDSHQLEQSLRDAGIGLGSGTIGFSLRQDGSPRQDGQVPPQASGPAHALQPELAGSAVPASRVASRLLDLEV